MQVAMADSQSSRVRVFDSAVGCPEIVNGEEHAKVTLSPHNGAKFCSFQWLVLEHNACTIDLSHTSDCVYYVIEGAGSIVDAAAGSRFDLTEGHMVHIDAGDRYRIEAGTAAVGALPADASPPRPATAQEI